MRQKTIHLYSGFLHFMLIALAASTVFLATKNRALERQLTPEPQEPTLVSGDLMEPFVAQDLDGLDVQVGATDGDPRDRLLFFFTTTCGACQANQEKWRTLYEKVGERYEVVGVSFDPLEATRQYREDFDLPFEVVSIADPKSFAERYKVDMVPLTVRLGADGRVRNSWLGVLSDQAVEDI